jgi:hypothetical protein
MDFDGMKIFSATKHTERDALGDLVTAWRKSNPSLVVIDTRITQSSDNAFHCVTIAVFYKKK